MKDSLHTLAEKLGFRSLRQQLTLLFALLLTASIGAFSLYIGLEQAEYVDRLERERADEMVRHMAGDLAPPLATGNIEAVVKSLQTISRNRDVRRLTVTDRQGLRVASVGRPGNAEALEMELPDNVPIPLPSKNRSAVDAPAEQDSGLVVAWAEIGEYAPMGWLRLELIPTAAHEIRDHIFHDSLFAGLVTLIFGTAAILIFLRPPLRSLERATAFAQSLEAGQGAVLNEPGAVHEVSKLVDALNWTSIRLFDGQSALTESESRNRAVTQAALDCIITIDNRGLILEFNPAAERTFGITRADALYQQVGELIFPPRLRDAQAQRLQEILESPEVVTLGQRFETHARRNNGEEFPVEIALVAVENAGRRHFTAYLRDISDQKHAQEALRTAMEAAEANSRSKSDFLANMSHEIRTPMNAILGMTDLTLDTELSGEQREYLGLVKGSAESLLNIINDILDFSKIEAGKLDFEHIDFSLRDCITLATRTLHQRAAEKDLQLVARIAPETPDSLRGDPHRLRQVLINLISNGIKFTSSGEIRITVRPSGPADEAGNIQLAFSVEDTGVGIPKDKQGVIFEAFSQADTSTTRRYGGTGLGLTISAQLVRGMGGQITVESEPGVGSTFNFSARFELGQASAVIDDSETLDALPVLVAVKTPSDRKVLAELLTHWRMAPLIVNSAEAARRELAAAVEAGHPYKVLLLGSWFPDGDGFELARELISAQATPLSVILLAEDGQRGDGARCREQGVAAYLPMPVQASDLLNAILLTRGIGEGAANERPLITRHTLREQKRQLQILLTEDNPVNQTLALRLLGKLGHQVKVANNGVEALELHAAQRFDIILMDVQMPVMGGFETTAEIRRREAAGQPHTPIVAMTAHAMKGDRERCLQAGMDGYLSKPIHAPDLVEALSHHTGGNDPSPTTSDTPVAADAPVYDRKTVLENLGGDEDLLAQLVVMYQEDEARMLGDIEAAIAAGDAEALYSAAHSLKGAVANFSAPRAQFRAAQLEQMGRKNQLADTAAMLVELRTELAALREAFSKAG